MYGALVRFVVKAGMRDEFLELLRWDEWPRTVSPALCDSTRRRWKKNLTRYTSMRSTQTLTPSKNTLKTSR